MMMTGWPVINGMISKNNLIKKVSCEKRRDLDQATRFLCLPGAPKRWCTDGSGEDHVCTERAASVPLIGA